MESSVEDYISQRCENALINNAQYMELQRQLSEAYKLKDIELYSILSAQIQSVVETTIYHAAAYDTGKFLKQ